MTEIKLKPCPFCGGMSAMFTRVGDAGGARGATRVWHLGIGCTECNIRLEITPRVTHWMPTPEPLEEGGTENEL